MAYGEQYADVELEQRIGQLKQRDECAKSATPTTTGLYGSSIADRIHRTLREAQSTYDRAAAAQRAKELIEKHPEFAELLDLLSRF